MVYPAPSIISHPRIPLAQHLLEAAKNIKAISELISFPDLTGYTIQLDSSEHLQLASLIGGLHDLGKATSYFQTYIRTSDKKKQQKMKNDPHTNHAKIGALYGFYTLQNSPSYQHLSDTTTYFLSLVAYIAIARHHGNLKSLRDERNALKDLIYNLTDPDDIMRDQLDHIDPVLIQKILDFIASELGVELPSWDVFVTDSKSGTLKSTIRGGRLLNGLEGICDGNYKRKYANKVKNIGPAIGFLVHLHYSLLQDGDKTSAMRESTIRRKQLDLQHQLLEYYQTTFGIDLNQKSQTLPTLTLSTARSRIFREAIDHAKQCSLTTRIFTLEAPTGSGKTLSNSGWAFQFRKRLEEKDDRNYRIIYLLPFLSIIEQTHTQLLEVLNTNPHTAISSDILLKHHYLSDTSYSIDTRLDEYLPNEALFFLEGWNAEIIVSTFHQFFHSLLTNRKSQLRKFNKYTNAIFVMDEIQALPIKYWNLFNLLIPQFLEFTNSYLLFSTATLPGIFEKQPPTLSTTGIELFKHLNRTVIDYHDQEILIDQLVDDLKKRNSLDASRNFLFVLNTKRSADLVYSQLQQDADFEETSIFYLSANIIPIHRKQRLDEIKQALETKQQVILVSTQVIEAGVDLSFACGFRDLAPFDSIIQTIGRINRHGKSKRTQLVVAPLVDEHNHLLATYVYDSLLITASRTILKDHPVIEEIDYRKMTGNYFEEAKRVKSQYPSQELAALYCKGEYGALEDQFELIPPQSFRVPVFIPFDATAKAIWQRYLNLPTIRDWKQRKDEYITIKPALYQYIVNVNQNLVNTQDFTDHNWVFHLQDLLVSRYYDQQRGFTGLQASSSHFIL